MKNKVLQIVIVFTFVSIVIYALVSHSCQWELCPYKGQVNYVHDQEECQEESDCYQIDKLHMEHPELDYDQLDDMLQNQIASK